MTRDEIEDNKDINNTSSRVLCGGSFILVAVNARSASRYWLVPPLRIYNVGFRPARTFTP
jgi:hypothetical protein